MVSSGHERLSPDISSYIMLGKIRSV